MIVYQILGVFWGWWVLSYYSETNAASLKIPQKKENKTVYVGNNATLICRVKSDSPIDLSKARIVWEKIRDPPARPRYNLQQQGRA